MVKGEKSVFQCNDCKSIMKFDASDLLQGDTYIRLEDDEVYTSNRFSIPYTVLVVSGIPFCPFCNGTLVLLHNRLLDIFHEYRKGKDSALMLTLPAFLERVLDIFKSVQQKSIIQNEQKKYVITEAGKNVSGLPFDNLKDAVEELKVFIADNFDVRIMEWNEDELYE